MECPNCSAQIEPEASRCQHCGHELAVKVLSRQERDNFNGITIEEKGDSDNRRQYAGSGDRPRVKQVNIAFDSSSWTGKLIVAAILGLLVFFFLPLFMFVVLAAGAVLVVVWLLRMFSR
ncbi:zinc ribbon domain-containing protein [Sporomusa malonica]|uniref:Zinc-ribbon domain-containing protein n=1 Tax=Sporomusa malonica TaxID=112901 RepID=A0A1W2DNX8_9FIRM|nr:zinc ribbon domain-containing protein [Sporomusa malonica]SMC99127.1 zinc-ribbon domain-containing protein [Sporomusa malonica]